MTRLLKPAALTLPFKFRKPRVTSRSTAVITVSGGAQSAPDIRLFATKRKAYAISHVPTTHTLSLLSTVGERQLVNPKGSIITAILTKTVDGAKTRETPISSLTVETLSHIMSFFPVFVAQITRWIGEVNSASEIKAEHLRLLWCIAQVAPEGKCTSSCPAPNCTCEWPNVECHAQYKQCIYLWHLSDLL